MGNSAFYFYPQPGAPLVKLDLGVKVTSVVDWEVRDMDVSRAISGALSKVIYTAYNRVSIRIDLLTNATKIAQLETFLNYMRSGGYCSFAEDTAGCFAAFSANKPTIGFTSVTIVKNLFDDSDYGSYSLGSYVVLQGPSPTMKKVVAPVSGASGRTINLNNPVVRDLSTEDWILVRDKRFWPWLRLDPASYNDVSINPNQGRVSWSITLEFFEPPDVIDRIVNSGVETLPGSDTEGLPNTDEVIDASSDDALSTGAILWRLL